jgi:hypothetical protein
MCGWWWTNGTSAPWYAMIFGPITMLAFHRSDGTGCRVGIESRGVAVASARRGQVCARHSQGTLCRGEIDRSEYEERKKLLSSP